MIARRAKIALLSPLGGGAAWWLLLSRCLSSSSRLDGLPAK